MTTRIIRATDRNNPVTMALDDAPTFGFDHDREEYPCVFASLTSNRKRWWVQLGSHDALMALHHWTEHALGHGMTTPAELGARLSTVPHAEHLVYGMLAQMPDSMAVRIFHVLRERLKDIV